MSFYAGRLNGTPVLSLRTQTGGDVNQHVTPDAQTIFHSSMPHVIITDTYGIAFFKDSDDYYTCEVPVAVRSLLSTSDTVVLTVLTVRDSAGNMYDKAIQGGSCAQGLGYDGGLSIKFFGSNSEGVASSTVRSCIHFSNDLEISTGYYSSSGNLATRYKVAKGTGGMLDFGGNSVYQAKSYSADFPPDIDTNYMWYGAYTIYSGKMTISQDGSNTYSATEGELAYAAPYTYSFPLNTFRVPTGRAGSYDRFYVRMSRPSQAISPALYADTSAPNEEKLRYQKVNQGTPENWSGGALVVRASIHDPLAVPTEAGRTGTLEHYASKYSGYTPVKVTWYVTNVKYNSSGTYDVTNPFTGNDIKLSAKDFTVRGVNLNAVTWKFLQLVSRNSQGPTAGRSFFATNLLKTPDAIASPVAALPLPLARQDTGVPSVGGGDSDTGWSAGVAGLYGFAPGKGWQVSSQGPSISNDDGVVWGPSNIPMKLFANNIATANIGGNVVSTGGNYVVLTTINLGMNTARDGAVLCTLEMLDGSLFKAGGFGGVNGSNSRPLDPGDSASSGIRTTSTMSPYRMHQILTMPVGFAVPVYSWATGGRDYASIGSGSPGVWRYNNGGGNWVGSIILQVGLVLSLKTLANGNVQVGVHISKNSPAANMGNLAFVLPNMRITVQKLA